MCALLIYVFNGFSPENHYFCMRIIQLYIMMTIDNNTGLVLEGGGMRGVFTSGVLDGFMKHGLNLIMWWLYRQEHATACRI